MASLHISNWEEVWAIPLVTLLPHWQLNREPSDGVEQWCDSGFSYMSLWHLHCRPTASQGACHWASLSHDVASSLEREGRLCAQVKPGLTALLVRKDLQWTVPLDVLFCLWCNCGFTVVSLIGGAAYPQCAVWPVLPADHKKGRLSTMCKWTEA